MTDECLTDAPGQCARLATAFSLDAITRIGDPILGDADARVRAPLPFIRVAIVGGCAGGGDLDDRVRRANQPLLGHDIHALVQDHGRIRARGREADVDVRAAEDLSQPPENLRRTPSATIQKG